jgi:hypothetical protein
MAGDIQGDIMKCTKCKFKDENTGICKYPFETVAVGDHELSKNEI